MEAHICSRCGGSLSKKDGYYVCVYCRAKYEDDAEERAAVTLKSLLDEAKLERLSNARRALYDQVHRENPSEKKTLTCVQDVLSLYPDDVLARFYDAVLDEDPSLLNELLRDLETDEPVADEIIRYGIKGLKLRNVIALKVFAERHFDDQKKIEVWTSIEEEAAKLDDGIYSTAVPRDVFLAYSSADQERVAEMCDFLEGEGFHVFVAYRNLRHGVGAQENYLTALYDALRHCKVFLFLSSNHSRSLACDALRVEAPYVTDNLKDVKRIEYILDEYTPKTPISVKILLKKAFPTEWCTNKEDLVQRLLAATTQMPVTCPKCFTVNAFGSAYCQRCGEPLSEEARNRAEAQRNARAQEEAAARAQEAAAEKAQAEIEEARRALEEERQRLEQQRQEQEQERQEEQRRRAEIAQAPVSDNGGTYSVRLLSFGSQKVPVIKAVQRINGMDLMSAKNLVDQAPVVIKSGLPYDQASAGIQGILEAGGKAEMFQDAPAKPVAPAEKTYTVRLDVVGSRKVPVIKVVQSITGEALMPTHKLVESAPVVIKTGLAKEVAEKAVESLRSEGAKAVCYPDDESGPTVSKPEEPKPEPQPAPSKAANKAEAEGLDPEYECLYEPIPADGGRYIYYGVYPRSKPKTAVFPTDVFEGSQYALENHKLYGLLDGQWWLVEPLKWRVLGTDDFGKTVLLAEEIIDAMDFNDFEEGERGDDYPNDWSTSNIREFLNGAFLKLAFPRGYGELETNEVDLGPEAHRRESLDHVYDNTFDRVFLLSSADVVNPDFGFEEVANNDKRGTRIATPTEFALGQGLREPVYYLRTYCPYMKGHSYIECVIENGAVPYQHVPSRDGPRGVRPAIELDL